MRIAVLLIKNWFSNEIVKQEKKFINSLAKLEFESIRSISILIFNVAVRLCMRT